MNARTLLWIVVLVVAAVVVFRLRQAHTEAARTLTGDAIPAATAYAHAIVPATRCGDARDVADASAGDPCETFQGLHGQRVLGRGRIARGCPGAPERIRNDRRVRGADCVQFRLGGRGRDGLLSVWLRRSGGKWLVDSAGAELHGT